MDNMIEYEGEVLRTEISHSPGGPSTVSRDPHAQPCGSPFKFDCSTNQPRP
jgi:hypothetical protein